MLSEKDLAISLHDSFCMFKDSQCRWYYEISCGRNVWKRPTHKLWLEKAQYVIKGSNSNIEQIREALDTFNEVRRLLKKINHTKDN